MKRLIRVSESELIGIIRKVLVEQSVGDITKCTNKLVDFLFEKSVYGKGENSLEIVDGGDLALWTTNNEIPEQEDLDSYNRFVELLKEYVETNYFEFEECEGVTWQEVEPLSRLLYVTEMQKRLMRSGRQIENSGPFDEFGNMMINLYKKMGGDIPLSLRRKMNLKSFAIELSKAQERNPVGGYNDEFQYADNVIEDAMSEYLVGDNNKMIDRSSVDWDYYYDIVDFLKEEFGSDLFEYYYSVVGPE